MADRDRHHNTIEFAGLVIFMPQLGMFVLPRVPDHDAILLYEDVGVTVSGVQPQQHHVIKELMFFALDEDHVQFPNAVGPMELNGGGYLPRLSKCCPGLGAPRDDVRLAARIYLPHGDFSWTGHGRQAITTVVDVESDGPLIIRLNGKEVRFQNDANVWIANSDFAMTAAHHWEHYYEFFSSSSNCNLVPPNGLCQPSRAARDHSVSGHLGSRSSAPIHNIHRRRQWTI